MEGYVKNLTSLWKHAMKREVGPGEKISLDSLYEQYGAKYDIKEGKPFVDWLRQVKLKDPLVWEIRFKDTSTIVPATQSEDRPAEVKDIADTPIETKEVKQKPFVKSNPKVEDLVNMSVRQAREVLPKFTDQKLLKYALNEASQLAGKDTICQMLRKRITLLELSRR